MNAKRQSLFSMCKKSHGLQNPAIKFYYYYSKFITRVINNNNNINNMSMLMSWFLRTWTLQFFYS